METNAIKTCHCADCPGAGCTCGCRADLTAASCNCGPACGCEGGEQGCVCA